MIFDRYEFRARLAPAVGVASPLVLPPLAFGVQVEGGWMWTTVAATVLLVVIYIFSFVVRHLGKRIEQELWDDWGGPPSTTIIGPHDHTFHDTTKGRIYSAVLRETGIDIDPSHSDVSAWKQSTWEAFRFVRQFLRERDKCGLWFTHDAEYGGLRNLLGGLPLAAGMASTAVIACGAALYLNPTTLTGLLTILAAAVVVLSFVLKKHWLPGIVRVTAFRYAESAWTAFLSTSSSMQVAKNGGMS